MPSKIKFNKNSSPSPVQTITTIPSPDIHIGKRDKDVKKSIKNSRKPRVNEMKYKSVDHSISIEKLKLILEDSKPNDLNQTIIVG